MMQTVHHRDGDDIEITKGAPETILKRTDLSSEKQQAFLTEAENMANRSLRVMAFLRGKKFLGLIGQIDPPRSNAAEAVEKCLLAGIKPVMVTGDHKVTGQAIAKELGIFRQNDQVLDGAELDQISDDELAKTIDRISVFARVHPTQKLRIIEAHQKNAQVVAMTGDGVNDAPALVKADVGVAMGSGTEVAKQAATIVILDDNFESIVSAVEQGRVVYRNIQKAILLLCSTSIAEVTVLMTAMLLGYPPPFTAVQILWNNLVTEGVITVNLVMEPAEGDEMNRKPLAKTASLISRTMLKRMAFMTPAIVLATLGWYIFRIHQQAPVTVAQTEAFVLLAICEWFNVLNCRSETKSAFRHGLLKNPWLLGGLLVGCLLQLSVIFFPPLSQLFHTVPIGAQSILGMVCVGSLVLFVEEIRKVLARRSRT
jgi:Ca2+-transporting ATPase